MTLLISVLEQGMIYAIMALGIYITYKILDFPDLSVDGTFPMGAAVTAMLILKGVHPALTLVLSFAAGLLAGCITGLIHVKLKVRDLLSGIIMMTALYSINLRIMGMAANKAVSVDKFSLVLSSRSISSAILTGALIALALVSLFYWYFGTEQGSALRATGSNPNMSAAQGINVNRMKVLGLALSNGIVALSGGLMAQYQGFADVNMGRGAIVIGLAAVIIGEVIARAILGKHLNFFGTLTFTVIGGVIYYAVVVIVLWLRLNSNDLKLFTAIIVAVFLAVPYLRAKRLNSFGRLKRKAAENDA